MTSRRRKREKVGRKTNERREGESEDGEKEKEKEREDCPKLILFIS